MPITKRQFELGIDSQMEEWMREVYKTLSQHRDLAYSMQDLRQVVGLTTPAEDSFGGPTPDAQKLRSAVDKLALVGAIEGRLIAGDPYYGFSQEIDTDTWQLRRSA